MRRAALGEVEAPVGRGRDRLQPALRRRGDDDGERRLGRAIGGARVGLDATGQPIAAQLDDLGAERGGTLGDRTTPRQRGRGAGEKDPPRTPQAMHDGFGEGRCMRHRHAKA